MSKKNIDIPVDGNIIKIPLSEIMSDNYLPYAVEVAKERALPDVRDGLKPVHRRILYGAYKLKATPDKPYYKSARIVGDILGKYHPHGDASVYDAMVILTQDFTTRKPLMDGHGNWGSMDGDNAAAMRYTEARLTPIALELLKDIEKDVVDMVYNYSDTELEPRVLPARFPNLLVNGAFGIAVGLATNIPPHNLKEVIEGTIAFIDNKEISTEELMNYIKGPDLPTGGILIGEKAILSAYEKGEGKVTLRAKTSIEKLDNDRYGIVITEFPYRRNKSKILQAISEMTADKKHSKALETIIDIRDESDRNGVRSVIEFKKSTDKETVDKVLKYLFKKTDLQINIIFNMVAIADGKPKTLGLKNILFHYINHQKDVIIRKTKKELEIAIKRFNIVEGFIKAIDIMDEIISTIRASKSKKDSEDNLVAKFSFTEEQAEAIVELMLYKLTGLEIKIFQKEYAKLEKEIKALHKILGSESELLKVIKSELLEVKDKYGDDRRTQIIKDDDVAKIELEEIILEEDIVITISNDGYIKRIADKSYKRSNPKEEEIEYREGDYNKYILNSNTKESIMFFTDIGNMYQLKCSMIPEMKWKEKGERLDTIVKALNLEKEKVISVNIISQIEEDKYFIFFTDKGILKKTYLSQFQTVYSKLVALKLKDEKLINVEIGDSLRREGCIKIKTKNGLEFTLDEPVIEVTDRNILGVQTVNIPVKDKVVSIEYTDEYDIKNFAFNIDRSGIIKISNRVSQKSDFSCYTNSLNRVLVFTKKGNVFILPAYMVQNLGNNGTGLSKLIDGFNEKEDSIINVFSLVSFKKDMSIYFFSKSGYVKRTVINEFDEDYGCFKVYKFKDDSDYLINVKLSDDSLDKDVLLITKQAMGIRFGAKSVNSMGMIASGVTGISLRDNDEVIYGDFVTGNNTGDEISVDGETLYSLCISSNNKVEQDISINDIKTQNRAGVGKKILMLDINDFISNIK
jgi:topoisomerase-4 subunit A